MVTKIIIWKGYATWCYSYDIRWIEYIVMKKIKKLTHKKKKKKERKQNRLLEFLVNCKIIAFVVDIGYWVANYNY